MCYFAVDAQSSSTVENKVCVVVRTYPSQFDHPIYSLKNFLSSMVNMEHKKLEIMVMLSDNRGNSSEVFSVVQSYFYSIPITILDYDDRPEFKPKGIFSRFDRRRFHHLVYTLTDRAISECSQDSAWLLVTNGDNEYNPQFFNYLDSNYDIISYDFYSRYYGQEQKSQYCNRLIGDSFLESSCLSNLGTYKFTDLGANVFNFQRFRSETRLYSDLRVRNKKPIANHDFLMLKSLKSSGWSVKHINKTSEVGCLMYHNPNYHSCINHSSDTVWNDYSQTCLLLRNQSDEAHDTNTNWIELEYKKVNSTLGRCIASKSNKFTV